MIISKTINLKDYLINTNLYGGATVNDPLHLVIPEGTIEITRDMVPNRDITSVTIPNSVTSIGYRAFSGTLLPSVTIPTSVTSIGHSAFSGTLLTSVTIPSSVTSIGSHAFYGTRLTSVIIPNSVTNLHADAFGSNVTITIGVSDALANDPLHLVIPEGTIEITEEMVPNRDITGVTIPSSVTSIGFNAFSDTHLTSVNIPSSVTSIGEGAFADTHLTSVTIPSSVTSIGESAFETTRLTSVTIPNSVTSIGIRAFSETHLTSVTIPNSVTSIEKAAFARTQLTSVTIPNNVTRIGRSAFRETRLTSVTIPNSVTSIGYAAFAYTQLTSITIPDSVTSIRSRAFSETQITSVTIPDSVTNFNANAFDSTVTITRGVSDVGESKVESKNVQIEKTINTTIINFLRRLQSYSERAKYTIDRNNVIGSILQYKNTIFNNDVKITFQGESGIDCGGLRREFFSLLGNEIFKKYFYEEKSSYCIIKNEEDENDNTINPDDYYFIGQLMAYAIKVKANINIRLHPIILHMILNSTYGNPLNISETKSHEVLSLINSQTDIEKLKHILDKISKELTDRKTNNMNTLEEMKQIMDTYDSTLTGRSPLSAYFNILNMSREEWNSFDSGSKSLCIDEAGMFCLLFMDMLEIPFEKKEWFVDFIIRSYIYGRTSRETEKFISGFHSIIPPELLRGLSLKDLDILIAGNTFIDIDLFLAGVIFIGVGNKLETIQGIIREYVQLDPTYLNKFLYWITGKETLPHDGFREFGRQLQVRFKDIGDAQVESHTCDSFVYVVLQANLLEDDKKLKVALSKESIISYSDGRYTSVGGSSMIIKLEDYYNQ
jgi:hypothetical protein